MTGGPDLSKTMAGLAEPFNSVNALPFDGLRDRVGDARVVLLGEAFQGTAEFYLARQRITRALIEKKDFSFVAIEGDWPDAERQSHYFRACPPEQFDE